MKFAIIAIFVSLCVATTMAHGHYGHEDNYHQHHKVHHDNHHKDHHDDDHKGHHEDHQEGHHDYYSHPKYEYKYGVKDLKTEDIKEQWEERDGDKVHGGYLLKEADGTIRVVNYHADDHTGFHAEVKTIGHAEHPEGYHKDDHHNEHHYDDEHHHDEHHYNDDGHDEHHHNEHHIEYKHDDKHHVEYKHDDDDHSQHHSGYDNNPYHGYYDSYLHPIH
ncbi:histidine-rich glycoprotein-like [Musca domestica]|uniref:Histidine-rich glycoprotein-like n=1 Tax=Musca domestica TaxID=7370 RepID=A0A9J7I4V2_MUSDO|nr:histidine-rich glycoprotein-like [Musca domestica]